MSQEEVERVYTINLGKVLLSPRNQRAKRAINMMREFATRHMKSENVKIEEDVSHLIWSRGIRHPPRKIRVKLTKDEDGMVLISKYQEEITKTKKEEKAEEKKSTEKAEEKLEKKKTKAKSAKKKTEEKPAKTAEKTEIAKEEKVKEKSEKDNEEKSDKVKEKPKESKSSKKAKKK